ncbi:MAG TPA: fibrobacter succinogenes major paralogous domain-containing protein [Longimicrobiales bacterium]|nr:fibrobacter succinogenes major paralogous domain-containing protein [Longimicrobiales bacterium]
MPDGKQWTTTNLNLDIAESYCYAAAEMNCRRYGRLYSWQSAQRGCQSLGDGWRLPTNDDWYQMVQHYGGIRDESAEAGRPAYIALSMGGHSGFNALLGGGRAPDGQEYSRLDAHGFYWTASETSSATAWFYNFGKGQLSVGRHDDGEKQRALSVRCVRD